MAYPGNFLRLVASGTLYGIEGFAFGISLVPNFPTDDDGPATVPTGVIDAIGNWWTSVDLKMGNHARLQTLKLNEIGPDGRYTKSTTVFHDYPAPGRVGTATNPYPAQVALAVSLVTPVRRGLAARGRFFLPAPVLGLGTDGKIPTTAVAALTTRTATMLDAVNTAMATADGGGGGAFRVGVASDVREGAFRVATGIRVGLVYDTIRSRRTSIPESYAEPTPLAQPA